MGVTVIAIGATFFSVRKLNEAKLEFRLPSPMKAVSSCAGPSAPEQNGPPVPAVR